MKQATSASPVDQREESHQLAARIKAESASCHPLVFAAKMVGFLSPWTDPGTPEHITVEDIDDPVICEAPVDGAIVEGLSFKFAGQKGEIGIVYLFEGFASIWPDGEKASRARIPADMIARYVTNYCASVREVKLRIRPREQQPSEQERRIREQLRDFLG